MKITIDHQDLLLTVNRAVFWQKTQTLVLSDMHMGKAGHFRKAGIPIPGTIQDADLQRLDQLVVEHSPETLLVVGDMFHSYANKELEKFRKWRSYNSSIDIVLVKGNHDILPEKTYSDLGIEVVNDSYRKEGFLFSHHPPPLDETGHFTISGHLHPGVIVKGTGRQQLRLPVYWISERALVLPAFSHFTGLYIISPSNDERIIAIAGDQLIEL